VISKTFVKIAAVGMGNLINAVIGFAYLSVIAKTLSLEDFGKYALLAGLLISISRLMDFGTNSIYVTKSLTENSKGLSQSEKFLGTRLILFIATIPISAFLLWFFHILSPQILLIFILGLIGYLINFTFYAFFQKEESFINVILLNSIPALLKGVFAVLIFTNNFTPDLNQAFAVFSLSMLSGLVLAFWLPKSVLKAKIDFSGFFTNIKESLSAGLSQTIYEWFPSINNGIAKLARGFTDVGIFSIANKMSSIFSLLSFSIFTVLLPKNAQIKKSRDAYDFKETVIISFGILLLAFAASFFGKLFINFFFGAKFNDSLPLLDILLFASAFTSIHTFIENYFFVENKTKLILYINVAKLIVFLIASVILIKFYDIYGLAVANLISAVLAVILTVVFIKRK